MHMLTASDNLSVLPLAQAAEVDPDAVVVSTADCDLTYAELDRWSNRMARLLLELGACPGTRVALAIDHPIESIVAERAATKIGASTIPATGDGSFALGTTVGVTTKAQRPAPADGIAWLVLDERSTLQRYLTGSDAPLSPADLDLLPECA
ncbi:AMP-binding protein [Nocardia amamiensis]|uniref:AMP-binding protein n=1 Tax=Nocardia amamiensis TaxID=404578 RepID=A0ABS0CJV7_9NOCA|nr:AMP-binding protein [Nocardia amamiensis]MBF6296880.1 AMP-binding protein [Nocardia amamiensis]